MTQEVDFTRPDIVDYLIKQFGGLRPFANNLELAVGTVQGWKKRGSVPATHQVKIRELLSQQPSATTSLGTKQTQQQKTNETVEKKKTDDIFSAFTNSNSDDDSSGDTDEDDKSLDISSEVWEHAALPRSTSGHWAVLISCIALAGVLTRPLWAERIDAKLMAAIDGMSHETASHSTGEDGEHASSPKALDKETELAKGGTKELPETSSDLLSRLHLLESKISSLIEAQDSNEELPALAELRRLKSEGSALAAAFDNQSARLDSLREFLQTRENKITVGLAKLNDKVDRIEKSRASTRLAQRLESLFHLDNVAHSIVQNFGSSSGKLELPLEALEQSLSSQEREDLAKALMTLRQANGISSTRHLLADYRFLMSDLLSLQARLQATSLAEKFRAQLASVFSIRRSSVGNTSVDVDDNPFISVELLLEDGNTVEAARLLGQATLHWRDSNGAASKDKSQLDERTIAELEAFLSTLATRNSLFDALSEIRERLSTSAKQQIIPQPQ